MDNDSIKDIAWPVNIESMAPPKSTPLVQNNESTKEKKKKYRRYCGLICCPCSLFCIALWLFCILLLLAVIPVLLILIIDVDKNMTTTASITINTTTTTMNTTITSVPITMNTTITSTPITMTTSSTSSTTTTAFYCGQSCLNQSWIDSSGVIASWPFDGSYVDTTGVYNGIMSGNLPTFATGYVGQAALFNASDHEAIYTSFIPLNNVSFTVQAWVQPTGYPNPRDLSIVGLCPTKIRNSCLHLNIRSAKLYFGFYYNDIQGATTILLNQWIHAAFVFDITTMQQTIYLNGFQDAQTKTSNALQVTSGNFTIGTNQGVDYPNGFYQGYIDQLSINKRPKSSCEILEIATLAAQFKFDTPSPYTDSGPNTVATTSSSTSIVTGYKNQAVSFTGSSSSYFQAWGFTSLGISNQAFSITFWIQPQILSGTLVHLSTSSTGTGSTCFPLLGFASNGAIIAQVLTSSTTVVAATGPILPVSSSWIPIVQTWSSTNGLKLYVNNTLFSSVPASTFLGSGTVLNFLTLGNCLSGCGECPSGSVGAASPFTGAIDDWRIYNRELSSVDVCALYYAI